MARTLAREHPELCVRRLDLEAQADTAALLEEILAPDAEDEVARRGAVRLAPRLVRAGQQAERLALPAEGGWRLAKGAEPTLAALGIEHVETLPPGPGEVQVAVQAAGLNFRDVLDVLGLVPVDAGPLGGEFAGRVLAVGKDVAELAPGDRVVGLAAGCFGERVTTSATLLAPCPRDLMPAAAATLPVVFVTAALAFELAGLRAGDRVLIHAGAGGVGLAAIQLARLAGAEVFATASAAKCGYLRGLGVRHVHDSRSTSFAAEILAATGGRGVDVVLNSLTGDGFIAASLSALAPGGRFVEISKRGIWTAEAMAAARPDVTYHILAVDRLTVEQPERVGAVLRAVLARVAAGELRALPYTSYPLGEARLAMRRMQQARHIGKIVLTPPVAAAAPVRAGVTYLITGGLGGIGLAVAGWLADRGATHLVLNGRRAPDAAAEAAVAALRARGVVVELMLADVAQAAEVDRLLAELEARMPPLAGVIHAAGLLRDGAVANQDWGRFAEVLGPKLLGAWHLHRATVDRPLELFVLFASTAGLLGSRGQANHAAANVFLDQLARHRRALGLAGLSVDWGAWSEIGEAAERRATLEASMEAAGIGWMAPAQGLAALERALAGEAAQLGVLAADWGRIAPRNTATPPLLQELLAAEHTTRTPPRATPPAAITQRLARLPAAQRHGELLAWLGEALQAVLRLPEPPEPDAGFASLGVDSLMAVELRNRLNTQLRLDPPLPATLLFDSPNLSALANTIQQKFGFPMEHRRAEFSTSSVKRAPHERPSAPNGRAETRENAMLGGSDALSAGVAIIGMACRFPLAPDLKAYWRLLIEGTDAVIPIPRARLDIAPPDEAELIANGKATSLWAGLIDGIEDFDALHFRISPSEAPYIDPQHRLLLEVTWHALEDAGIPAAKLAGSRTGVFVGVGTADFVTKHANDLATLTAYSGLGSGGFAAANRISHVFDFTGPSFVVNTACASSLTALHLAVNSLHTGECDLAVVGGVNLILHPSEFVSLSKAQMLSPTGRCRSFSSDADGYVRGEGCGVVVLRRHCDAFAAGDRIAAIIRGTAISHVGASNGLSAPNGPAQEAVMREAAARAGIDPACIDYLEAQGTGTSLGDAIEMGAIRNVMTMGRDLTHALRVGAVKSNIGNLEEASGMAGLIKTVLAMRHGQIPPTLHFRKLNPYIRTGSEPIHVATKAEPWPSGPNDRRIAAVSGFGFAGANAHVVLEESICINRPAGDGRPPHVLTVQSRTPSNLRRMATLYADALLECAVPNIHKFCFSANTGRTDFGYRLAVVGTDRAALVSRLRAAAEGSSERGIYLSGQRSQRKRRIAFLFSEQEPFDVAPINALYGDEPVFRDVIDRCEAVYERYNNCSLRELLKAPDAKLLTCARYAQPALYALQSALVALWESWGIRPDCVLGVGVGELAATVCAGVLDLEDGMALVIERARLINRLPAGSGMALAERPRKNVSASVIPADAGSELAELAATAGGEELLSSEKATQSPSLKPLFEELESFAVGILHAAETRRLFTTMEDFPTPKRTEEWPLYWREQLQRPRDFVGAMRRLDETGVDIFVEIGPGSNLVSLAQDCVPNANALWLASLQAGYMSEREALIEAFAALFAAGCTVDFAALHGSHHVSRIDVPLYQFERQRYWLEDLHQRTNGFGGTEVPALAT
jgi:acyl transferase domain-containing protein/NADPH:quinone reductase-like Zn-dependent oxidoreductase